MVDFHSDKSAWVDQTDLPPAQRLRVARLLIKLGLRRRPVEHIALMDGAVELLSGDTLFLVQPDSELVEWACGESDGKFRLEESRWAQRDLLFPVLNGVFGHATPPWW